MTITEFLLARIAEDEADARTMQQWIDEMNANPPLVYEQEDPPDVAFADLNRVLAECEAKRRIVEDFGAYRAGHTVFDEGRRDGLDLALRALAAVYADHPDFDPAWRI